MKKFVRENLISVNQ